MLVYGKYECFVMQMLYVCVLWASCGSSKCCILHALQFIDTGRGCKRRPYVVNASFRSKVRPRTFGCVAMGTVVLFILRSILLLYSAGAGVNRV